MKEGRDPDTYCNDTVVRIPKVATPEEDKKQKMDRAREMAEGYLKDPPLVAGRKSEAVDSQARG